MKFFKIIFLILLSHIITINALADEATQKTNVFFWTQKISTCFKKDKGFSAHIFQENIYSGHDKKNELNGQIKVLSSGQFVIEYEEKKIKVAGDNKIIKTYDASNNLLITSRLKDSPIAKALYFLINSKFESLDKKFKVRFVGSSKNKKGLPLWVFEMVPVLNNSFIKNIVVTMEDSKNNQCFPVARVVLIDKQNNAIRLTFTNKSKGIKISKKDLSIKVAPGVKTIHQ